MDRLDPEGPFANLGKKQVLEGILRMIEGLNVRGGILTKKVLIVLALCCLVGGLPGQERPGVLGAWTGYTVIGDGSRVDVNLSLDKGGAGYTGTMEAVWMTPELPLKNIVFKEGKLTCEFDLMDDDGSSQLIKVELTLDKETLKGHWIDADGKSDIIELTRKK